MSKDQLEKMVRLMKRYTYVEWHHKLGFIVSGERKS